ncbi:hypothetical protein SAMN05892883_2373 [Jatrophihabitans sp. GAS493]|uniref:hypothetical protein n=1 Tax=Jatrophihabitans sp. GAS493 TaxID=1907575 RepID=UPI000BB87A5D|nr:hypothetical protein [Jatrophihabitans sp. GAS493]SOD73074.1 hypothetical protein SAMN05892883_2373 [Jatrophihabitans sp. GAS493]
MPKRHTAIDEAARYCLVIGAVLFLIANLMLGASARGAVLVLGELFVIVGILGMVLAWIIGSSKKQQQRAKSSRQGHPKRD